MAKMGRPVGSKNVRCAKAQIAITQLIDNHSADLTEALLILKGLDPEKFINCFCKLAEYAMPKLARTEMQPLDQNGQKSSGFTIDINHVKPPKD